MGGTVDIPLWTFFGCGAAATLTLILSCTANVSKLVPGAFGATHTYANVAASAPAVTLPVPPPPAVLEGGGA